MGTIRVIKDLPRVEVPCVICKEGMDLCRGRKFAICDSCLETLREIVKEKRNGA